MSRTALLVSLPILLLACGKSKPEGESASAGSSSAAASAAPAASGAPAAGKGEQGKTAEKEQKGIVVAIKDLQLFHPYSPDRTMPSVQDDGTFSTRDKKLRYGLGLVVEATNATGEVLHDPWFEGEIRFSSGELENKCAFSADPIGIFSRTFFLSYAPPVEGAKVPLFGPKSDWKSEDDSLTEEFFRPSERIRMITRRNECEGPVLADLGAKKITGRVVVKARRQFIESYEAVLDDKHYDLALLGEMIRIRDRKSSKVVVLPVKENVIEMIASSEPAAGAQITPLSRVRLRSDRAVRASLDDTIESAPVEFELNPQTLTLQLVKLASSGEMVHASGNVLVYTKDGKVVYEDMARQKMNMLELERADVPQAAPEVSFKQDELSGKVTGIELVHFTDDATLPKGQRKLRVKWKLHLESGEIEGRLRAPVDVATSELDQATSDLDKLGEDAEPGDVAKAKMAVAAAKAAKTAAEAKYKTGLSTERGRIAKLLSCADVKLSTNKGLKGPSNGKDAGTACKALLENNDVEVTLTYTLDRYEVPVALSYSLGKEAQFKPIANEALLVMDPR